MSDSFQTPWTEAQEAPVSIRFPRQEYWNELSFPSPRDLPDPGIKSVSPAWQVDPLPLTHQGSPWNFFEKTDFYTCYFLHLQIHRLKKKSCFYPSFCYQSSPFYIFCNF